MGRAFTKEEKEAIYQGLVEKGKELFTRYGIKKTTVDDLTGAVGISKGIFYQFFNSKEELFQEIFEMEVAVCREKMSSLLEANCDNPQDCVRRLIRQYIEFIEKNPFFRMTLLHDADMPGLKSMVEDETIRERRDEWIKLLLMYLHEWRERGLVIDGNLEVIAATIRSTVYLLFHKSEIGTDVFYDIIDLLSELISESLFKEGVYLSSHRLTHLTKA
jgi:AcrR family transcriptional regulator